jgi:hypothetical protein
MARAAGTARGLRAHLTKYVEDSVVVLGRTVTRELQKANPKDTQWSAAHWIPSVGRPSPPVGEQSIRRREEKLALVTFAGAAQAFAIVALSTFRLRAGKIFNTNSVPYIQALADGYSPKAPPGWVPMAIETGITYTYIVMRA